MQHVLILRCKYLCQSRLGPRHGAYRVTSYASVARVSRGYMFVPARVSRGYMSHGYMVCVSAHVAWLHGLPIALALALALTRGAGSASFNAVAFLVF